MIDIKNEEQIKLMEQGGKILSDVLWEVCDSVKEGITEYELDQLAEKLIRQRGGEPGFMKVEGYKHTICVSTNNVVVHGIPGQRQLKNGDIIGIDCGVFYQGFHTDMSETVAVGNIDSEVNKFLTVGKLALHAGIKQATIAKRIGDISNAIQTIVEKEHNYSVVRALIGHGVGRELHEEPEVPGYLIEPLKKTPKLKEGMTLAIEVIYNMRGTGVNIENDGWTIISADGSVSGVFERTVAITKNGPLVLTPERK